jgi:two-component system sensor histidine kinase DesK
MTAMAPRRSAGIEAIDLATRGPLYLVSGSEPLLVLLVVVGQPQVGDQTGRILVLTAVPHAVACVLLLRAGLARFLGGRRPALPLLVVTALLTVVGVVAALRPVPAAALVFGAAFACALAPLLSAVRLTGLIAAAAVVAGVLEVALGPPGRQLWAVNCLLVVGGAALSYRFSIWLLGVAWEINQARDVEARLAVAEERLRFARDLHDVLGRNLALIAVNSQLAAELARRGQDGAVERMLEVHRTAQDSMREVRDVVAGSHATDLGTELAGARSVLRSAGITVRVIGDGVVLPAQAQVALGWVVREVTTNIIRHSDPSTVRIELEVSPTGGEGTDAAVAVLRIENDGVRPRGGEGIGGLGPGTGLNGLRERLATFGGDLSAGVEPGARFVVRARLPLAVDDLPLVSADRSTE